MGACYGLLRRCDLRQQKRIETRQTTHLCGRAFMMASISLTAVKLGPSFSMGAGSSAASARAIIDMHLSALAAARVGCAIFNAHGLESLTDSILQFVFVNSLRLDRRLRNVISQPCNATKRASHKLPPSSIFVNTAASDMLTFASFLVRSAISRMLP